MINYKNGNLTVESVDVSKIVSEVGTPFYCYSYNKILDQYRVLAAALSSSKISIYFAVKANSNLSILKELKKFQLGADVVSIGELMKALKSGINPKKIVFSGVGKTSSELGYAIDKKILLINTESKSEIKEIDRIAKLKKKTNTNWYYIKSKYRCKKFRSNFNWKKRK